MDDDVALLTSGGGDSGGGDDGGSYGCDIAVGTPGRLGYGPVCCCLPVCDDCRVMSVV